jgi:phosphate acetyltransferase
MSLTKTVSPERSSSTTTSSTTSRMPHPSLYVHSTEPGSGKALVSLGVLDLILRLNPSAKVGFFRPVISSAATKKQKKQQQHHHISIKQQLGVTKNNASFADLQDAADAMMMEDGERQEPDEDTQLVLHHFKLPQTYEESYGLRTDTIQELLGSTHHHDEIVEIIIGKYKALEAKCDFVLCEGRHGSAVEFNVSRTLARNLGCPILILGSAHERTCDEALEQVQIALDAFGAYDADIVGVVLNKAAPRDMGTLTSALEERYKNKGYILSVIPYDKNLSCPRMRDVVQDLNAEVIYGKSLLENRVSGSCILGTMQLQNVLNWIREDNQLLVTSGDRGDIIVGAMQAHRKLE